jgi:beta-lactamase class A
MGMAAIVWLSFGHASEQPTASPLAQASTSPRAQALASSLAQEAATSIQRKKRSAGYPKRTAIAHALAWAGQREGNVGVAVVDSHGVLRGYHAHRQFQSASLAKAMLLVAYLGLHPRPAVSKRATLTKMIGDSTCL